MREAWQWLVACRRHLPDTKTAYYKTILEYNGFHRQGPDPVSDDDSGRSRVSGSEGISGKSAKDYFFTK